MVKELEALRSKYGSLLTTAKSHEEMAGRAAREGQLRAEEVRTTSAYIALKQGLHQGEGGGGVRNWREPAGRVRHHHGIEQPNQ